MPARTSWVVTVIGVDRPGLVDALSEWVVRAGGDWLDSHLVHVGNQFAGILEVQIPEDAVDSFQQDVPQLEQETGLRLELRNADTSAQEGVLFEMNCVGQDRPGIVRALTDILMEFRANVERLDTAYRDAAMSGEQLFEAKFCVRLPADADLNALEERLSDIGDDLMLDVQLGS